MSRDRPPHYALIFCAHNGPPPWPCDECDKPVESYADLNVHHRDHDHGNDEPLNLGAMHDPCHTRHHKLGFKHTEATKAKISAARRGVPCHSTTRAAAVLTHTGRSQSPEQIAKRLASRQASRTERGRW